MLLSDTLYKKVSSKNKIFFGGWTLFCSKYKLISIWPLSSRILVHLIPLFRRYECSAVNDYGRATGHALVHVRQTPGATDALVIRAFQDATEEIDRAINKTLSSLFSTDRSGTVRVDPFRAGRFPNAIGRAAARPAEIFERTLVNIRRLVDAGAAANVTSEFRYEEILSSEQVRVIPNWPGETMMCVRLV